MNKHLENMEDDIDEQHRLPKPGCCLFWAVVLVILIALVLYLVLK